MGREGGPFDPTLRESLLQLGSIRKMPLAGGRRGAKAAPMPAHGLWCQVVRVVDDKYFEVQQATPLLLHIIGRLAAVAGVTQLALKRECLLAANGLDAAPVDLVEVDRRHARREVLVDEALPLAAAPRCAATASRGRDAGEGVADSGVGRPRRGRG